MAEEETFYVQIRDPINLRKDILVSSKQVIMTLKKYEEMAELRKHKMEMLALLREKTKEIRMLANQLVNFLPKTKLRAEKSLKVQHKEEETAVKEVTHIRKEAVGELDKLESELASIERKIENL